jgi:type IX secretion system PorP/SprF family membrane protein
MKKITLLLVVAFIALTQTINAQDIHFSQFYLSPLNLNPAMTGVMNCTQRLTFNHRNQWAPILRSNSYQTYSFSYDQRIPVGRNDYFGVGGSLWRDQAGQLNFAQTQANISGSYSKQMAGDRTKQSYLVVGTRIGVQQTGLDYANARWGTQHDANGGWNQAAPSLETNLNRDNIIFADMSAGLLWFTTNRNGNNFYIGAAYDHLNRANVSFNKDKKDPLYSKFTVHTGGEIGVNEKFALVPNIVWQSQGKAMQLNPGVSAKFILSKYRGEEQSFQIGAWGRIANRLESGMHLDATILTARFDYNQYTIGFSYDITSSSLRRAGAAVGTYEFALLYNICGNERRKVYCPRF